MFDQLGRIMLADDAYPAYGPDYEYQLPGGSYIFYRNGRVVMFYMPEKSEDFEIQEVNLIDL